MSYGNQTSRPGATLESGTNPSTADEPALLANTEYSHTFSNVKQFTIKARGTSKIQFAFVSGASATNFITIARGAYREFFGINWTGTLYFQCDQPNEVLEITKWI